MEHQNRGCAGGRRAVPVSVQPRGAACGAQAVARCHAEVHLLSHRQRV